MPAIDIDSPNEQPPSTERLTDEQLGLEFPCVFPVKVMGRDADNFAELILEILGGHADTSNASIKQRPSSSGKYLSVTVSIETKSRAHLDEMYMSLNAHDRVLMTL